MEKAKFLITNEEGSRRNVSGAVEIGKRLLSLTSYFYAAGTGSCIITSVTEAEGYMLFGSFFVSGQSRGLGSQWSSLPPHWQLACAQSGGAVHAGSITGLGRG